MSSTVKDPVCGDNGGDSLMSLRTECSRQGVIETARHYARERWLRRKRRILKWSAREMAKRIGVTVAEYEAFEKGEVEELPDIPFDEIKYYIRGHIDAKAIQSDFFHH